MQMVFAAITLSIGGSLFEKLGPHWMHTVLSGCAALFIPTMYPTTPRLSLLTRSFLTVNRSSSCQLSSLVGCAKHSEARSCLGCRCCVDRDPTPKAKEVEAAPMSPAEARRQREKAAEEGVPKPAGAALASFQPIIVIEDSD